MTLNKWISPNSSVWRIQVSMVLKNKNVITESRGVSKERKPVRKDVQQNIDEVLPKWSMNQRSMNSIISGSILQAKAEELPKLFNVAEFRVELVT